MAAPAGEQIHRAVQDYYGKELQRSEDLKTNACVTPAVCRVPKAARAALERIHEEVVARYYGCGLVLPERLESCCVLDLGSGSGRDCYLLSQLVGEKGHVTGIDMTAGQVEVAKKHIAYHMDKFGYRKPNVDFIQGYMEKLGDVGLADESYDIVISNCVINLSPDKRAVLREAYRVLKPGGEMYFSDVYASQRLSEAARAHRVLWGECLAGALCWRELYGIAQEVGFSPPRLVAASPIAIGHEELQSIVGDCRFVSATFRLFKVPSGGRAGPGRAVYNGGIAEHERELAFDANFTFKEGEAVDVDADTAAILRSSRFAEDFSIQASGVGADANAALPGCCRGRVKIKAERRSRRSSRHPPRSSWDGPHVSHGVGSGCPAGGGRGAGKRCSPGALTLLLPSGRIPSQVLLCPQERICDPFQLLERPGAPAPACGPHGCC